MKEFEVALSGFVAGVNEMVAKRYESYPFDVKIEPVMGRRYVKLVRREIFEGGNRWGVAAGSAYCFIDKKTGDVLKAASWSAPAKGVRSNIYAEDFGLSGVSVFGANYLR